MVIVVTEKQCKICKETKPLDEYYSIEKTNSKGKEYTYFFPHCKKCNIEKAKNSNFDKELHKELCRQWRNRPENRGSIRKHLNKYRDKGGQLEWQRNNKDKIQEYANQHQSHEITTKEWESCLKYFNYSCAYCGISQEDAKEKYNNYFHKEHVNHKGSNDLSNCVPACKSCNSKKWTYELEEWYKTGNPNYQKRRLNKILKWTNKEYKRFLID